MGGVKVRYLDLTDEVAGLVLEDVKAVVEASAIILRDAVVRVMEEAPPRTGREYLVPGTRTPYRASAAREAPAVRTGAYRNSWQFTPAFVSRETVTAFAYTDLATQDGTWIIGRLLEEGTESMAPRDHVEQAVALAQREIEAFIRGID